MNMKINFLTNPPGDTRGENSVMSNFRSEEHTDLQIFIREFLQNVLDNTIKKDSEALVKINIQQINDISGKKFIDNIFDPAVPHISAASKKNSQFKDNLNTEALILEEYETNGITGITNDSDADGNWAQFWHHQAKSKKSGGLNGRAGQGKISYNMMSDVWTIFGLTNTIENPNKRYLIGKCILPETYKLNGKPYKSQAFISKYEEKDIGPQPIPFEDKETIQDFCDAFSISRKNNEFGTTWVIPFPKDNPEDVQIIEAVITGYYYSILKKRLAVQVGNILINQETIIDLALKHLDKSDANFYAFIKEIFDEETSLEYEKIRFPSKWAKHDSIPEDFLDIDKSDKLKKAYHSGEIVSVKLPITLHPKNREKIDSFITVFLKSDKTITNTIEAFIRTDLVISGEKKIAHLPGIAYALIVADDPEIAAFLADSEIANHTKFNWKMLPVNENYEKNKIEETLAIIRKGVRVVYQYLQQRQSQRIEDLLNKFISVKASKGPNTNKTKKEEKKKEEEEKKEEETTEVPEIDEDIETNTKYFKIKSKAGSFKILPGSKKFSKEQLPARMKIITGYETIDNEGIKAFKNHHPLDYNFKDPDSLISVQLNNLSRVKESDTPNELQLDVENNDFSAEISGFKTNCNLRVTVVSY